jgi:hypothetical protein
LKLLGVKASARDPGGRTPTFADRRAGAKLKTRRLRAQRHRPLERQADSEEWEWGGTSV